MIQTYQVVVGNCPFSSEGEAVVVLEIKGQKSRGESRRCWRMGGVAE
jgi:hypothetical protein